MVTRRTSIAPFGNATPPSFSKWIVAEWNTTSTGREDRDLRATAAARTIPSCAARSITPYTRTKRFAVDSDRKTTASNGTAPLASTVLQIASASRLSTAVGTSGTAHTTMNHTSARTAPVLTTRITNLRMGRSCYCARPRDELAEQSAYGLVVVPSSPFRLIPHFSELIAVAFIRATAWGARGIWEKGREDETGVRFARALAAAASVHAPFVRDRARRARRRICLRIGALPRPVGGGLVSGTHARADELAAVDRAAVASGEVVRPAASPVTRRRARPAETEPRP